MEDVLIRDIKSCSQKDLFIIILNKLGFMKFKSSLPPQYRERYDPNNTPSMFVNITEKTLRTILELDKLLLYTKGVELKLYGPHNQRRLIEYITNKILDFIGKSDIVHINNIIMELVDNAEKANFMSVLRNNVDFLPISETDLIVKNREEVVDLCQRLDKWVKISWKFSKEIFKVEVSNNVPISREQAKKLRDKASADINNIVDGFVEDDFDDKIGAGLGLYFVKFFIDDLKQRDIDTIFRLYSTERNTYATIALFFEKF
ncbi:MAG: hypothetical protein N2712_01270 [Brevinematales bacterium]|nr:hypothetical protein [Brevinematales bacterium]